MKILSRIFLAILLVLILTLITSCKSSVNPQVIENQQIHPSRPASIPEIKVDWNIIPKDNQIMYALDEHDFKMLNKLIIEASEYNEKNSALLCYYRKDLNEDICKY